MSNEISVNKLKTLLQYTGTDNDPDLLPQIILGQKIMTLVAEENKNGTDMANIISTLASVLGFLIARQTDNKNSRTIVTMSVVTNLMGALGVDLGKVIKIQKDFEQKGLI